MTVLCLFRSTLLAHTRLNTDSLGLCMLAYFLWCFHL